MDELVCFVVQPVADRALRRLSEHGRVRVFENTDRTITRDELLDSVKDASVIFGLGRVEIDGEVMDAAPGLRHIAVMSRVPTGIDVLAATERSIAVTGIPPMNQIDVAELVMALLLGLARRIPEADSFTRDGRFGQHQSQAFMTTRIAGKSIGLFGLGRIGKAVAQRARSFEMDVLYHKPDRLITAEESELGVSWVPSEELLARSDFLVLCSALNSSTRGLIDAEALKRMKPTAQLINVSRGAVVVEADLVDALQDGVIAGAGLDVFADEPHPHPGLLEMPNVILTPHIGSATHETREKMANEVIDAILDVRAGRTPKLVFNPSVLTTS